MLKLKSLDYYNYYSNDMSLGLSNYIGVNMLLIPKVAVKCNPRYIP